MTEPVSGEPAAARAGALLSIDLDAIRANYRRLRQELQGTACAAVVKANAYGLGAARVAPALADEGVRSFFVALPEEAIALRGFLAEAAPRAAIFVLGGILPGIETEFLAHDIIPVLNSLGEVDRWREAAKRQDRRLPAALHIDTGMNRLGLPKSELDGLADDHDRLEGLDLVCVMSHLACAEVQDHPLNLEQLGAFRTARARLPEAPASFANSSGLFLGSDFHFDLGRPGVALYGVNPTPNQANPMAQVVRLKGKILQLRDVDAPQSVGYGATYRVPGPVRVATVAVGYADGYLRSLSNRGVGFIGGHRVPVVGRVSMDLITFDVSEVPVEAAQPGALIDLFDPERGVDALADQAGSIGYEILTSLGSRYHRTYLGG